MLNLAFKHTAAWALLIIVLGCASQAGINPRVSTQATAILGVTIAPGVEAGRSQNAMGQELEDLMQAEAGYSILRSSDVDRAVSIASPGSFDAMLSNYASSGQLKGDDVNALQAARMPVQTALIARIEKNKVQSGAPKRVVLRNNLGHVLSDRERVVLATEREMQIRASMVNVASGRVIWSKTYRVTPVTESSYVHYSGSSFSGSLAASFANTMSNGLKVPSGPVPPSNLLAIRSLLREIVRNLPK